MRILWERKKGKGRLLRLNRPAQFEDREMIIYEIDDVNSGALAKYFVDQDIPSPLPINDPVTEYNDFSFSLLSSHNCLDRIFNYLSIRDIFFLQKVSRFFYYHINKKYFRHISLPLSDEIVAKLEDRSVLSLSSCCNLVWIPDIEVFMPFKQLNLSNLRELKIIGKNAIHNTNYQNSSFEGSSFRLHSTYHSCLHFLLSHQSKKPTLQKLEILTDDTDDSFKTINYIKKCSNLKELVLHGIGHFNNCAIYTMDPNIANMIVEESLMNKRIRVLKLVKFVIPDNHNAVDKLNVSSDYLEELAITDSKTILIGQIRLPALVSFTTDVSTYLSDSYITKELKESVFQSCPKLRYWNNRDLEALAKESPTGQWLDNLNLAGR